MVQIAGKLKLRLRASKDGDGAIEGDVQGLVAECQLIESSSILELSIPQATFTSTVSLDCTILSVDTKYVRPSMLLSEGWPLNGPVDIVLATIIITTD